MSRISEDEGSYRKKDKAICLYWMEKRPTIEQFTVLQHYMVKQNESTSGYIVS